MKFVLTKIRGLGKMVTLNVETTYCETVSVNIWLYLPFFGLQPLIFSKFAIPVSTDPKILFKIIFCCENN